MPKPKVKENEKSKRKMNTTIYDENGNWNTYQHQDALRKIENKIFVEYYKDTQKITGGDEEKFNSFVDMLRKPLDTTFWINDTDPLSKEISEYLVDLSKTSGVVSPIHWYPYFGMAWRICGGDKVTLRKSPEMQTLRRYLIEQTAMGTISRQEEVSMIPPFLLDIHPNDSCLDMCASPGSKTAQMLVELARQKKTSLEDKETLLPFDYLSEGFLIANELNTSRANMLVHQIKRLRLLFPFSLFTNHDARYFPEICINNTNLRFDKILCDVVCSGDGTIRKAPFIFKVWSPREALNLQKLQIQIGLRASHLLKVGGRMVYSTCSLNPIENEASVSQIIHRTGGAMRLIDARTLLPNLKCDPGLTTWKVTDNKGNIIGRENEKAHEALFPIEPSSNDMNLAYCMRLMPEHCNGGAFFIAVLEKMSPWELPNNFESENREDINNSDEKTESKFKLPPQFVSPNENMLLTIKDFYKIPDFPFNNLVVRTATGEKQLREDTHSGNVNLVSNGVLRILKNKSDKICVISAGLRVLAPEHLNKSWRITYEATSVFLRYLERNPNRILEVDYSFVLNLIAGGKLKDVLFSNLPEEFFSKIENMPIGTVILKIKTKKNNTIVAVALRARTRIQLLVDKEDVVELLHRMGISNDDLTNRKLE